MNISISEKVVLYRLKNQKNEDFKEPIGAYIKRERLTQGLNQDYVCKGICSVSYFSRIENNKIIPSKEYIDQIFLKLNRQIPQELMIRPINSKLIDDFLTAIEYRSDRLVEEAYHKIIKSNVILPELYSFALYVYQNKLEQAKKYIELLHGQQNYFNDKELLLFLEYLGSYYMLNYNYVRSNKYLSLALKLIEHLNLNYPLLLYKYAWNLGKLNHNLKCIDYSQRSEVMFNKKNNLYRAVQCKLLIAIKLSKQFPEKAIELYEEIIKVTRQSEFIKLNKISNFNLALLVKRLNNFNQSQNEFIHLLNMHNEDIKYSFYIYVEYLDLLLVYKKFDEAKLIFKKFKSKCFDTMKNHFYFKYYEFNIFKKDIDKKLKGYRNDFIPYSIKTKNRNLEIRFRKEFVKLLENNNNYQECIKEYKKLLQLMENNL